MSKTHRFLYFTSWAMIAVGIFSIVTGIMSLLGFSELISDKIGDISLMTFLDSGSYFILCGAIHVASGICGLRRLENKLKSLICIFIGIFTLAWQLAAFIYLFTLGFLSIRAALMVVLPIIFLVLLIASELKVRLMAPQSDAKDEPRTGKVFVPKQLFGNFNFTFKRKTLDIPVFEGKRRTRKFGGFNFGGKRRTGRRIRMRKFKKR